MKMINDSDIHKGHRSRMRKKLSEHGLDIFDTYEILEMLLYSAIPAKDTNPVAKQLLASFGSLEGVLSASADELCAVKGIGDKTARLILSVARLSENLGVKNELSGLAFDDYERVGEYFAEYFRDALDYKVAAMLLDNSMKLIAVKTLYDGIDYQSAGVKASAFVEFAISHGASVVITAHNHPFGPSHASSGDMATNRAVMSALSDVGVMLADHYVVVGDRYVGFMSSPTRKLAQQPELQRFYETKAKSTGRDADAL